MVLYTKTYVQLIRKRRYEMRYNDLKNASKPKTITIRIRENVFTAAQANAKKHGVSLSEWFRISAIEYTRDPKKAIRANAPAPAAELSRSARPPTRKPVAEMTDDEFAQFADEEGRKHSAEMREADKIFGA